MASVELLVNTTSKPDSTAVKPATGKGSTSIISVCVISFAPAAFETSKVTSNNPGFSKVTVGEAAEEVLGVPPSKVHR